MSVLAAIRPCDRYQNGLTQRLTQALLIIIYVWRLDWSNVIKKKKNSYESIILNSERVRKFSYYTERWLKIVLKVIEIGGLLQFYKRFASTTLSWKLIHNYFRIKLIRIEEILGYLFVTSVISLWPISFRYLLNLCVKSNVDTKRWFIKTCKCQFNLYLSTFDKYKINVSNLENNNNPRFAYYFESRKY